MISGNSLSIVVSDEGPGIPPAQLRWIFERYRQARESDRRQGSGLGLYIVKGIMEAHGGTVHVETGSSGRGSRFILTFPDAVRFSAISRIG
jgi:two-component system sensor histidine kinase KdpD